MSVGRLSTARSARARSYGSIASGMRTGGTDRPEQREGFVSEQFIAKLHTDQLQTQLPPSAHKTVRSTASEFRNESLSASSSKNACLRKQQEVSSCASPGSLMARRVFLFTYFVECHSLTNPTGLSVPPFRPSTDFFHLFPIFSPLVIYKPFDSAGTTRSVCRPRLLGIPCVPSK